MKKVTKQIQPLDEEELEKDLRFAFTNRSETEDQFIEEVMPTIKYHLNEAMSKYQAALVDDISRDLRAHVLSIVVRSKRETIVEDDDETWYK